MEQGNRGRALIAACAIAVGLGAAACGSPEPTSSENDAALPSASETLASREGAPVTLTGCLQQRDGTLTDSFILTGVTDAGLDAPAAAAGDARTSVERQQVRAAMRSYRLDGDDDELERNVGKQVRVTGRLAEASDMRAERTAPPDADRPAVGTGGERKDAEIEADDLAEVEVESVQIVADACGTR
jgi:hypothetical protein